MLSRFTYQIVPINVHCIGEGGQEFGKWPYCNDRKRREGKLEVGPRLEQNLCIRSSYTIACGNSAVIQ